MAESLIDDFVRPASCQTCPFHEAGLGRELRDSLAPGRWDGILKDLRQGKGFPCHELPTRGKGKRICAGSLAWQRQHRCVPDAVQVVERIAALREARVARW